GHAVGESPRAERPGDRCGSGGDAEEVGAHEGLATAERARVLVAEALGGVDLVRDLVEVAPDAHEAAPLADADRVALVDVRRGPGEGHHARLVAGCAGADARAPARLDARPAQAV